jgi:hypothetical protein
LIRLINERNFKPGDRLPTQDSLRTMLSYSHNTLTRAMRSLVDYGVVKRRPSEGTVVADPDAVIPDLWTVGMAMHAPHVMTDNLSISTLQRFLTSHLSRMGCASKSYIYQGKPAYNPKTLSNYPGLEADIDAGRVNAVLSPAHFPDPIVQSIRKKGVVVYRVGVSEVMHCGVLIDSRSYVTQAVQMLAQQSCHRVRVIASEGSWLNDLDQTRQALIKVCRQTNLSVKAITAPHLGSTTATGRAIGQYLLSQPEADRPDGLIVMLDTLAIGLSQVLVESNYRPRMTVLSHRQIPVPYFLPVHCFDVDIDHVARQLVDMIIQRLKCPGTPDEIRWIAPQLAEVKPQAADNPAINVVEYDL